MLAGESLGSIRTIITTEAEQRGYVTVNASAAERNRLARGRQDQLAPAESSTQETPDDRRTAAELSGAAAQSGAYRAGDSGPLADYDSPNLQRITPDQLPGLLGGTIA